MTVEDYLRAQCTRRVDQLKQHMEGLTGGFEAEAAKGRQTLRDIATSTARDTLADAAPSELAGAAAAATAAADADVLCDPFALVSMRGCHAGRIIKLQPTDAQHVWTIGRVEDNDISLTGDDEVSSSHAQITFERKQFKLMDLGSTNGTFATNGTGQTLKLKKKKNHVLKVDHLITFGSCTFKWCYFTEAQAMVESVAKLN